MSDFARNLDTYGDAPNDPCPVCGAINYCCECGTDDEKPESDYCKRCGKDRYDFSDIGCSACDARHPNFGVLP